MFYDHEILTSRKHGVATIWLMGTLGTRTQLKKATRKAIMNVDVPQACGTISDGEVPLALRLQGSLLIGVSRVFSQQCRFMLADTQSLSQKMRGIRRAIENAQTDPSVVVDRSDQLNLPNDHAFNLELDMGLDFALFDISSVSQGEPLPQSQSQNRRTLSPASITAAPTSMLDDEEELSVQGGREGHLFEYADPIAEPNTDTSGGGELAPVSNNEPYRTSSVHEPGIDPHPHFSIAEDGSLIIGDSENAEGGAGVFLDPEFSQINLPAASRDQSFVDPVSQVDHTSTSGPDVRPVRQDGDPMTGVEQSPIIASFRGSTGLASQTSPFANIVEAQETSVEAAQQSRYRPRTLQADRNTVLENRELRKWTDKYLDNMARLAQEKADRQSLAQAKRVATFWVLEQGIGGVQVNFGADHTSHPFTVFKGVGLLDSLIGERSTLRGRKRSLSATQKEDAEEVERRVRSRSDRPVSDMSDGLRLLHEDDAGFSLEDNEPHVESEMGRRATSSLKDRSSEMPWNLSSRQQLAYVRSSTRPRGAGSSVGDTDAVELGPPPSASKRYRSRLTSASPLLRKGMSSSRFSDVGPGFVGTMSSGGGEDFNDLDDMLGIGSEADSFELPTPQGGAGPRQASQSGRLESTLERDSYKFLGFVRNAMTAEDVSSGTPPSHRNITFEKLLPPGGSSSSIAAQGLLHVLALATKGLLVIEQEEQFGEITIALSGDGFHHDP